MNVPIILHCLHVELIQEELLDYIFATLSNIKNTFMPVRIIILIKIIIDPKMKIEPTSKKRRILNILYAMMLQNVMNL